jgi:hypothetical protein
LQTPATISTLFSRACSNRAGPSFLRTLGITSTVEEGILLRTPENGGVDSAKLISEQGLLGESLFLSLGSILPTSDYYCTFPYVFSIFH